MLETDVAEATAAYEESRWKRESRRRKPAELGHRHPRTRWRRPARWSPVNAPVASRRPRPRGASRLGRLSSLASSLLVRDEHLLAHEDEQRLERCRKGQATSERLFVPDEMPAFTELHVARPLQHMTAFFGHRRPPEWVTYDKGAKTKRLRWTSAMLTTGPPSTINLSPWGPDRPNTKSLHTPARQLFLYTCLLIRASTHNANIFYTGSSSMARTTQKQSGRKSVLIN